MPAGQHLTIGDRHRGRCPAVTRETRSLIADIASRPRLEPTQYNLDLLTNWEREILTLIGSGLPK